MALTDHKILKKIKDGSATIQSLIEWVGDIAPIEQIDIPDTILATPDRRKNYLKNLELASKEFDSINSCIKFEDISSHTVKHLNKHYRRLKKHKTRLKALVITGKWQTEEKQKEIFKRALDRIRADITLRIKGSVSSMINYHVKKNGDSTRTILKEKLGYSIDDLMKHLEAKFNNKMDWDNYGAYWHIDHIIPASWFIYDNTDDDQFKKCWSLSNLQPLEATKNCSKGNRFIG